MSNAEASKSNVPEFSVSELAFSLKKTLEENYGRVRVRGELSRVMIAGSGHLYSSLKDEDAVLDAVCWKGSVSKLSVKPEEGLEVICTGRVSSYPKSSKYQLVIESMELAGEGALLKMLEERRKKLAAEGLFDEDKKKDLPFLPEVIGVVTSPTGAVIRDILHRLSDRFPRHVLVWPVLVQGKGAAEQVTAAIEGFQSIDKKGLPRPDILIVARGGGSLEDLMAFNEENVVRAIAASDIPVISAVGHETDTTLVDFAADMRAPTPTGAAEMAVPVRDNLRAQVLDDEQRLLGAMTRMLSENRHKLEAQTARLGDPAKLLDIHRQNVDHLAARLRHPKERLADIQKTLERWSEQLVALGPKLTKDLENRLQHAGKMLEAFSFENVLERGFVVVQASDGSLITEAGQTSTGQAISLRFKQSQHVDAVIGKNPVKTKQKSPKEKDENQTNLFGN